MDLLPPQSSIDEFERERAEKKRRERNDDMPILGGMNGLPPQWVIDEFNAE